MDKTLILSERHCSVLELNEVVIGLSAKDVSVCGGGSRSCLALICEYGPLDFFGSESRV